MVGILFVVITYPLVITTGASEDAPVKRNGLISAGVFTATWADVTPALSVITSIQHATT